MREEIKSATLGFLADLDVLRWNISVRLSADEISIEVTGRKKTDIFEISVRHNELEEGQEKGYQVQMTGRPRIVTADSKILTNLISHDFEAAKQSPSLQWIFGSEAKPDRRSEVRDAAEGAVDALEGKITPDVLLAQKIRTSVMTVSVSQFIDWVRDEAAARSTGFTQTQMKMVFGELKAILVENGIDIEQGLGIILDAPGQEIPLQQALQNSDAKDWASIIYVTKQMDFTRLKTEGANFQSVAAVPLREVIGIENGNKMPVIMNEADISKLKSKVAFAVSATGSLQQGQEGLEFLALALQLVAGTLLSQDKDIKTADEIKNPLNHATLKKSLLGKIFNTKITGDAVAALRDKIQDAIGFGRQGNLQIDREVLPLVMQYLVARAVARAA